MLSFRVMSSSKALRPGRPTWKSGLFLVEVGIYFRVLILVRGWSNPGERNPPKTRRSRLASVALYCDRLNLTSNFSLSITGPVFWGHGFFQTLYANGSRLKVPNTIYRITEFRRVLKFGVLWSLRIRAVDSCRCFSKKTRNSRFLSPQKNQLHYMAFSSA